MKKKGYYLLSIVPMIAMLAIQIVVGAVLMLRWLILYGPEAGMAMYNNSMTEILVCMQFFTLLITGFWYYLDVTRSDREAGRAFSGIMGKKTILILIPVALGAQFLSAFLMELWGIASPQLIEEYNQMILDSGVAQVNFFSIIATVILAPLGEEVIFRGLTLEYLRRAGAGFWVINVVQALLFGFVHLNLVQGSYAFFMGLCCGYVVLKYRSLLAGMILHLVFNAYGTFSAPLLGLLFGQEAEGTVSGSVIVAVVYLVLGAALAAGGFYLVNRECRRKT